MEETKMSKADESRIMNDPATSKREREDLMAELHPQPKAQTFFKANLVLKSINKEYAFFEPEAPMPGFEVGTVKLARNLFPDDPDFNADFMSRTFDAKNKEHKGMVAKQAEFRKFMKLRMTIKV